MKRIVLITIAFLLSPSIVLAQTTTTIPFFCKGDFNYDGAVAADDVTTFLQHFGRSQYNNPCPPDGPAPVPKTGRRLLEAVGDLCCDGFNASYKQIGVEWPDPRFTNNGDGTVTDNLTGLIWLKEANCFAKKQWKEALILVDELASGTCGLSDGSVAGNWRIPNRNELESLLDMDQCWNECDSVALPANHPFTYSGSPSGDQDWCCYWTSTTYPKFYYAETMVWTVNMSYCDVNRICTNPNVCPENVCGVWPVRGRCGANCDVQSCSIEWVQ